MHVIADNNPGLSTKPFNARCEALLTKFSYHSTLKLDKGGKRRSGQVDHVLTCESFLVHSHFKPYTIKRVWICKWVITKWGWRLNNIAEAIPMISTHLNSMEFHCYLVYKLRYTYSKFQGRHIGFSTSGCIWQFRRHFHWNGRHRNLGVAVRNLFLSHLEVEICLGVFLPPPHWQRPFEK